jgi:hypothetical protein
MGIACGVVAFQLAPHGDQLILVLLAILATFFLAWLSRE